jgi:hypothetical protein
MRGALLASILVATGLAAEERGSADPRAELAPLEQALSQAADQIARPNVFALTGAECRGYRIEGLGAVFVLPPRAVRSRHLAVWRVAPAHRGATRDRQIRVIELQAEELQREAARTHAQVERAIAEVQREVDRRRAATERSASAPAPVAAPSPPDVPAPPLPPPPPWSRWLEAGPSDEDEDEQEAPADAVVARMRAALVEALAEHAPALSGLRVGETIAVAIDFVPSFPFGPARPDKTLVVRVRKKDLDERRAGRIGIEQLKSRIEAVEY